MLHLSRWQHDHKLFTNVSIWCSVFISLQKNSESPLHYIHAHSTSISLLYDVPTDSTLRSRISQGLLNPHSLVSFSGHRNCSTWSVITAMSKVEMRPEPLVRLPTSNWSPSIWLKNLSVVFLHGHLFTRSPWNLHLNLQQVAQGVAQMGKTGLSSILKNIGCVASDRFDDLACSPLY